MENKEKNIVDRINELIKKSFGRGARGNYTNDLVMPAKSGPYILDNQLDLIVRRRVIIPLIFEAYQEMGRFLANDGSSLVVHPVFGDSARKYSDFYEARFGVRPTIQFKTDFNNGDKNKQIN